MASLSDLLAQTMLFTGAQHQKLSPVPLDPGTPFHSPKPKPQELADVGFTERVDTVLRNPIWRFRWDPSKPGTFTQLTICSRGMGMDYGMAMPAYDKVEFTAKLVRLDGTELGLPLDPSHMVGAWWSRLGTIPEASSGLWRLEAKLDVSIVVAFGFQLGPNGIEPLTLDEITELGDELMPSTGIAARLKYIAGEPGSAFVCVGPSRYIVAIELVLCKERPDFVPGEIVGFARIHPHGFVWSNEELTSAEVAIELARPSKTTGCGDPAMKDKITALVVADTNDVHSTMALIDLPVPYTDVLYDYYCTEPFVRFKNRKLRKPTDDDPGDHPMQEGGEITLADARFTRERIRENAVSRHTLLVRDHRDIRKCKRQGQFDNVHMAARMKVEFTTHELGATPQQVVLDEIVMINQCFHDCIHMHVRWTEFIDSKLFAGWGPSGPHSQAGVPGVPPNQTVFASFPTPSTLRYRALAERVRAGVVQVFCHHGMAYAVDQWPTLSALGKIEMLHGGIRAEAIGTQDAYAGELPAGWLEFYWRVRWTGAADAHVERLTCRDLEWCMR